MQRNDSTAQADGVDIHGPDDAPSVVFVHGAVFTRSMWAPQRDALASDRRIIAPDLPGHGSRAAQSFEFERAVDLVESVIKDYATEECLLVGLSLGGYVATEYANRHPDRIDGLVLSGSSANPVDGMELLTRAAGGIARLATRSDRIERFVEDRAAKWVRERPLSTAQATEITEAGFYPRTFGTAGPQLAGRDFRDALAAYPGPTLILNGERDYVMRRGEDEHAAAAPQGSIEVIDDAGHVCTLHRPTAYTDALREFMRQRVLA
ncbi:alpha/beta fold hydrolase [Halohasta salina]|uniref:alpha/beta fold hydrolase n=1 Tax=Halohasta salina TaxID=2961621 RepID=UPI0020A56374|nr:alpha/beta hydrolase [Halohasta salina]